MIDLDLNSIINSFFDNKKLDGQKFRLYILDNFQSIQTDLTNIINTPDTKTLFQKINDFCAANKNNNCKTALSEIKALSQRISGWIKDNVESEPRFDFFIMTKAAEISSGDQEKDY